MYDLFTFAVDFSQTRLFSNSFVHPLHKLQEDKTCLSLQLLLKADNKRYFLISFVCQHIHASMLCASVCALNFKIFVFIYLVLLTFSDYCSIFNSRSISFPISLSHTNLSHTETTHTLSIHLTTADSENQRPRLTKGMLLNIYEREIHKKHYLK